MRSTYVQIAFAQVIIIGLARFGFSDTGHPPALITPAMESGQAGASIARLTNFLNAAVVAEESFKPKTALAYYEKAKLLDPSSSGFVEAVMAEYYRKYFPYEYYQMHRSGSAAQSAFMDAYRFYNDNREYEHALRLLDDPPTIRSDTHPLPLSLLREASIESMRIRPGVRNVVVPSETGALQTNTVRCFARLPLQTNLLASADRKFQVEWEESRMSRSNRVVWVANDTKQRFAIMDCPRDVNILWSPSGKHLAIQKNLAPTFASVVRVIDTETPLMAICVEDILPASITQTSSETPVYHMMVNWLTEDCLSIYCFTTPSNSVPSSWPLRLVNKNSEWMILNADQWKSQP